MEPISKWTRFFNLIIDLLVVRFALLHYAIYPLLRVEYPILLTYHGYSFRLISYLINALVFIIYYFAMEASTGLTIGKLITQTKIATVSGHKPTTRQILIRTLWRLVPFEGISWLNTGINGWHDTQSKTTLVSKKAVLI
ncbi:RDD family protein [Mucilaginibacter sp. McL0603]|uniref:RDD family protein n=1 Tax=Mucilaginibacter sp. McL0603 TaxID=3415670 RepID=UPI003CF7BC88